jgi:octaprenyl-diphosphate synthase
LLIAVNNSEFDYLRVTSDAVRRMSEGELLQIQKSRQKTIDEETYFRIISDKTASLISTCCAVGAISSTDDADRRNALTQFGELVGLAFQIRDDVLDYTSRTFILGKPVGNDIREGKVTLPLLYAMQRAEKSEAKNILSIVKSKRASTKDVGRVVRFVEQNGGIDAAQTKADMLSREAIEMLAPFEPSPYKSALVDFANFVVTRTS